MRHAPAILDESDSAELRSRLRRDAAQPIVLELLLRRDRGEITPDDDEVIATHPDLLPELAAELRSARLCRRAVVAGLRTGRAGHILVEGVPAAKGTPLRVPGCIRLEKVSSGGQAAVYRGVQESTGRTVAVKVFAGPQTSDSRLRARFEREAGILASLRHPHIVNIVDCGRTSDGSFFLVMDFVEGSDLDDWWKVQLVRGPVGGRRLLEVFAKICRAVEAAHARGIVHRDLKPSNLRVDEAGEPRVLASDSRTASTTRATRVPAARLRLPGRSSAPFRGPVPSRRLADTTRSASAATSTRSA